MNLSPNVSRLRKYRSNLLKEKGNYWNMPLMSKNLKKCLKKSVKHSFEKEFRRLKFITNQYKGLVCSEDVEKKSQLAKLVPKCFVPK